VERLPDAARKGLGHQRFDLGPAVGLPHGAEHDLAVLREQRGVGREVATVEMVPVVHEELLDLEDVLQALQPLLEGRRLVVHGSPLSRARHTIGQQGFTATGERALRPGHRAWVPGAAPEVAPRSTSR
jgi:hypothetical protein